MVDISTRFEHCLSEWQLPVIVYQTDDADDSLIVALSVSLAVFFLLAVLVSLCYYFRKYSRVLLYSRCGLRLKSVETDNVERTYDAFISFSQHDFDFVRHELMPHLESTELPYRLCVHYRDWPVGESISLSIAESVEHSHRTILLLFDNFMTSEWCSYEFQAAHTHALRKRMRHLIIVLLQDELPENMDADMLLYTRTHTYLKISDPLFWAKLRMAMPELTAEEIAYRNANPTFMQLLLAAQRERMARLGFHFQDGTVVKDGEENQTASVHHQGEAAAVAGSAMNQPEHVCASVAEMETYPLESHLCYQDAAMTEVEGYAESMV